jgi:Zn-finger nucleic acid-binding protein
MWATCGRFSTDRGVMNCRNCGAPMELYERRRYYFCKHCGTFHFIENPAAEDGIRVLERPSGALPCPLCGAPLATSLLDDEQRVDHCERCRGLLMLRQRFTEAVNRRRARETGPPVSPPPVDPRELQRQLVCPSCREPMNVHPYYGPGNVVIDTCSRCELIWLDFGELKQITEAPGRDRGRRSAMTSSMDAPSEGISSDPLDLLTDLFGS